MIILKKIRQDDFLFLLFSSLFFQKKKKRKLEEEEATTVVVDSPSAKKFKKKNPVKVVKTKAERKEFKEVICSKCNKSVDPNILNQHMEKYCEKSKYQVI